MIYFFVLSLLVFTLKLTSLQAENYAFVEIEQYTDLIKMEMLQIEHEVDKRLVKAVNSAAKAMAKYAEFIVPDDINTALDTNLQSLRQDAYGDFRKCVNGSHYDLNRYEEEPEALIVKMERFGKSAGNAVAIPDTCGPKVERLKERLRDSLEVLLGRSLMVINECKDCLRSAVNNYVFQVRKAITAEPNDTRFLV